MLQTAMQNKETDSAISIHNLFSDQSKRTPTAIALIDEGKEYTYLDLEKETNQLAHFLQKMGVDPETIVACLIETSAKSVIYLLSILKAGGAYLLLDPSLPEKRLEYMVRDAAPKFILTDHNLPQKLLKLSPTLNSQQLKAGAQKQVDDLPNSDVKPDNLAYIAYTSGSTGRPKGVLITHAAIVNHAKSFVSIFNLGEPDRVPLMAPLAFDVATEELIPPLISGCTLIVAKTEYLSMQEFTQEVIDCKYTILNIPAPLWHKWTFYLRDAGIPVPSSLRLIIVGSDKIYTSVFKIWQQLPGAKDIQWVVAYGTTETTVTSTFYLAAWRDDLKNEAIMPIGKPIKNTTLYIVNFHGKLVKGNEEGELYIGGHGLARGYHNLSDKTAQSFMHDRFSNIPGERIYKTGDLARYISDSNIMLLGRKDLQIKINGLRIELSEIEAVIYEYPQIEEAVVIFQPANNHSQQGKLIAYIETLSNQLLDKCNLQEFLCAHLHKAMVPSHVVQLEKIPLTASGKIDRKVLQEYK